MKLRIAHFIHRYPPALGGAETYFARLSRFLVQQGHEVRVHTSDALALEAFWSSEATRLSAGISWRDGVRVHRHPIRTFFGRRVALQALSMMLPVSLRSLAMPASPLMPSMWDMASWNHPIDIVHASAFPYGGPIRCAVRLADRWGVPFVLTPFLHLGDPARTVDRTRSAYLAAPLRWLLKRADVVLVQSQMERQAVLEVGLPEQRVLYQGLGVDPAECTGGDRVRAVRQWALPNDRLRIGHLANLSEEKGSVDLVRAAQRLWARKVPIHLVLAGPMMPNFRRFWHALPSHEKRHVSLLGVLPEEFKADFYAALDVFALPSRSDSFGLVLLEAWVNQVPCIGYRAGGVAEVIRHEQDGLLVLCGDVAALADAMERWLTRPDERQLFGQKGRNKCLMEHDWLPKLQLVRDVYLNLCGKRTPD